MCGVDCEFFSYGWLVDSFVVFQGTHYSNFFIKNVNLILPVSMYAEVEMSYLNLEGSLRLANRVIVMSIVKFFQILIF